MDDRTAVHSRGGLADRAEHGDFRRLNRPPPTQDRVAGLARLRPLTDVLAGFRAIVDRHPARLPIFVRPLHHDHRVRSLGDHRSGHDPRRLPRTDRQTAGRDTGPQLSHEFQHSDVLRQIRAPHREAVHRGTIGRRGVAIGDDVLCQHQTMGPRQLDLVDVEGLHLVAQPLERLAHVDHDPSPAGATRRASATSTRGIPRRSGRTSMLANAAAATMARTASAWP